MLQVNGLGHVMLDSISWIPKASKEAVGFVKKSTCAGVGLMIMTGGVSKEFVPVKFAANPNSFRGLSEGMYTVAKAAAIGAFHVADVAWTAGKGTLNFVEANAGDLGAVAFGGTALVAWHAASQTWKHASEETSFCKKRGWQAVAVAEGTVAAVLALGAAWSGGLINAHEYSRNSTLVS